MDFIDCPSIVTGVLCFGGDIDGGIIDVGILGGTEDQKVFLKNMSWCARVL